MKIDRDTEMMICAIEQGYTITLVGHTISFPREIMFDIWDILREDNSQHPKIKQNSGGKR